MGLACTFVTHLKSMTLGKRSRDPEDDMFLQIIANELSQALTLAM